jgi:hypothetical protein
MQRPSSFALLLVLLLAAATDARLAYAENCQDLLANNRYRCQVKTELGAEFAACVQFTSPGSLSSKFDMTTDGGPNFGTTLECECKAKGSFANPQFNAANKRFLCGNQQYGDAAAGTVGGHGQKITNGQYFFNDPTDLSYIFQCTLDPACQIN